MARLARILDHLVNDISWNTRFVDLPERRYLCLFNQGYVVLGLPADNGLNVQIAWIATDGRAASELALPVVLAVVLQRHPAQMGLFRDHRVLRRPQHRHFMEEPHS